MGKIYFSIVLLLAFSAQGADFDDWGDWGLDVPQAEAWVDDGYIDESYTGVGIAGEDELLLNQLDESSWEADVDLEQEGIEEQDEYVDGLSEDDFVDTEEYVEEESFIGEDSFDEEFFYSDDLPAESEIYEDDGAVL